MPGTAVGRIDGLEVAPPDESCWWSCITEKAWESNDLEYWQSLPDEEIHFEHYHIATCAYYKYVHGGFVEGRDEFYWFAAERELRQKLRRVLYFLFESSRAAPMKKDSGTKGQKSNPGHHYQPTSFQEGHTPVGLANRDGLREGKKVSTADLQRLSAERNFSSLDDHQVLENAAYMTEENRGDFSDSAWVGWSIVTRMPVCGGESYDDVQSQLKDRNDLPDSGIYTSGGKSKTYPWYLLYTITGPYT